MNGTTADATLIASNNSAIKSVVNGGIDDSNINASAGIDPSKLKNFPSNAAQALYGTGLWREPILRYSKVTSKAVNTTTSATDLLNGEITVGASKLVSGNKLRAVIAGDFLNNTGANKTIPEFQLVVGGTTLFDTGTASGATFATSASRGALIIMIDAIGLGSASQVWTIQGMVSAAGGVGAANSALFTTGAGSYGLASGTGAQAVFNGVATSTIDMTSSRTFVVNVINGFSNANYETRLLGATVDIS